MPPPSKFLLGLNVCRLHRAGRYTGPEAVGSRGKSELWLLHGEMDEPGELYVHMQVTCLSRSLYSSLLSVSHLCLSPPSLTCLMPTSQLTTIVSITLPSVPKALFSQLFKKCPKIFPRTLFKTTAMRPARARSTHITCSKDIKLGYELEDVLGMELT
jgi:hypothetical protein